MVVSGFGGLGRAPRHDSDGPGGRAPSAGRTAPPRGADVEGTATEVDDPRRLP
jgi:hypothetical protein